MSKHMLNITFTIWSLAFHICPSGFRWCFSELPLQKAEINLQLDFKNKFQIWTIKEIRDVIICKIFFIIETRLSILRLAAELEGSPKKREDEDTDKHDGDSFRENVRLSFSLKKCFFLDCRCDTVKLFRIMKKKFSILISIKHFSNFRVLGLVFYTIIHSIWYL